MVGAGLTALPSASAVAVGGQVSDCRLVQLRSPAGAHETGVIDVEVIDGETVYYGSYYVWDADGQEHQRAVVWRGLDGTPQPLDIGLGKQNDIAFELTETGLVNGQSDDGGDPAIPWVMDLSSGQVTVVDTTAGKATDGSSMYVRRINDAGAVVGSDWPGVGGSRNSRAYAWDHFTAAPKRLEAQSFGSEGWGVNNLGDRSGLTAKGRQPSYPHWVNYNPTIWQADGTTRELPRVGIDATAHLVKDDRTAAGNGWWGWSVDEGHIEAIFWPSFDEVVGLGVVDGGGWSRVFGLDEGGWAVGWLDQFVEESPTAPDGISGHGFLYRHGVTAPGHLRVLPSVYAVEHGVTDWRQWHTKAVHAVNGELDQAVTATQTGVDEDGRPTWGATVWVNASSCGVEVATTHDPWHVTDLESGREASAEAARVD